MEVVNLSEYRGEKLVVVAGDDQRVMKTADARREKESLRGAKIHPLREMSVSEALSDMTGMFLSEVQTRVVPLDMEDSTEFWDFVRSWSEKIKGKHSSHTVGMVGEQVEIRID